MASSDSEYERICKAMTQAIRQICPYWMRDQIEDLVQKAMLKIWQLENKSDKEYEFQSSYLWCVAHTVLIDEFRLLKKSRYETSLEDKEQSPASTSHPNPEASATGREMGRAILDCISKLIDTRRRAVILYLRGESARRIAELMGWTVRRAENLVLRGRQDLRRCLAAKGWRR